MQKLFTAAIKHFDSDGKKVKSKLMTLAINYTDAEAKFTEFTAANYECGEVGKILMTNISEVHGYKQYEPGDIGVFWYKCKVQIPITAENGKEKNVSTYLAIQAETVESATDKCNVLFEDTPAVVLSTTNMKIDCYI